jgi:hypothetical protein
MKHNRNKRKPKQEKGKKEEPHSLSLFCFLHLIKKQRGISYRQLMAFLCTCPHDMQQNMITPTMIIMLKFYKSLFSHKGISEWGCLP